MCYCVVSGSDVLWLSSWRLWLCHMNWIMAMWCRWTGSVHVCVSVCVPVCYEVSLQKPFSQAFILYYMYLTTERQTDRSEYLRQFEIV